MIQLALATAAMLAMVLFAPAGGFWMWLRVGGVVWALSFAIYFAGEAWTIGIDRGLSVWLKSAGLLGLAGAMYWMPDAKIALIPMVFATVCMAASRAVERRVRAH